LEIEREVDEVSSSFTSQKESHKSEMEQDSSRRSDGSEHTQGSCTSNRSRVGDTRILTPKYTKMAMIQDNEETLPSQGDLDATRDRHGGEPDAAGSTVDGRKSSEGTAGVVSARRVPLAHGAIAHQPDSTRKIDTIPDSAPTR